MVHTVMSEHDYVSPWMAQLLGLAMSFEVNIDCHYTAKREADPRMVPDLIDMGNSSPPADAIQVPNSSTGSRTLPCVAGDARDFAQTSYCKRQPVSIVARHSPANRTGISKVVHFSDSSEATRRIALYKSQANSAAQKCPRRPVIESAVDSLAWQRSVHDCLVFEKEQPCDGWRAAQGAVATDYNRLLSNAARCVRCSNAVHEECLNLPHGHGTFNDLSVKEGSHVNKAVTGDSLLDTDGDGASTGTFAVRFPGDVLCCVESFRSDQECDVIRRACESAGMRFGSQLHLVPVVPQPSSYAGTVLCLCKPRGSVHVLVTFEGNRADFCLEALPVWNEADVKQHVCVGQDKRLFLGEREWNKLRIPAHDGMCLRAAGQELGDPVFRDARMRVDIAPFVDSPWKDMLHSVAKSLRSVFGYALHAVWELPGELPRSIDFEPGFMHEVQFGMRPDRRWGAAHIFIFVDGSAQSTPFRQRAGSAFTVWKQSGPETKGKLEFVGYHAAPVPVTTQIEESCDLAAMAEITALERAIAWVMTLPCHLDCCLLFDSKRAGLSADGGWKPTSSNESIHVAACRLRCMVQMISQFHCISFQHVKAHTGCAGNELTDRLAKAAALGGLRCHLPAAAKFLWCHAKLPWAWMLGHTGCDVPSLEEVCAECVRRPLPPCEEEMKPGVVDVGLIGVEDVDSSPRVTFNVSLASFNVMTALDQQTERGSCARPSSGKLDLMQEQFHSRGWCFVGLQETRFREDGVWPLKRYWSIQTKSYNGAFGVALWISKSIPFARTQAGQLQVKESDIVVLHGDPRRLLVRICAGPMRCDICVMHAPQQARPQLERHEWWSSTRQILAKFSSNQFPLILLADTNGSVGQHPCHAIGSHGAEDTDENGAEWTELVHDRQLWVPSTFAEHHVGPTKTYVAVLGGTEHRNDLIAWPVEWRDSCNVLSWVEQDCDLGNKLLDHRPSVLKVSWEARAQAPACAIFKQVDWSRGDPRICREQLRDIPPIPWACSVDQHATLITKKLVGAQTRAFQGRRRFLSFS